MKATIHDVAALRSISPSALIAFARGEGWTQGEAFGTHADVYAGQGRPEIILPRTNRLADYPAIVSRLISIFAQAVERDEFTVYRELAVADRDVIRVRASGEAENGSIMLDSGVKIVSQAREMLLAAACAAKSPQPFYRAGANRDASEYIRTVKLGQTEHGSFVVTLLSPVPPRLELPLFPDQVDLDTEPMQRKVTHRLITALEASRTAVERALSGDSGAFPNAVSAGVSANLCEAVAGLIEESREIEISLTWARTRPLPQTRKTVTFSQTDGDVLREAARKIRLYQPKTDVTLYGTVNKLKRDQDEADGTVTLKAIVEDRLQSVSTVLDQINYSIATKAHDAQKQVIVTGDLERKGQRWHIINATVRELPTEDLSNDEGV